jgi:tellurite resistance protein TehA-like permease
MGTGVVSILLHTFPYPARWLYWLSIVVFCFDLLLFTTLTLITILRFTLYPAQWRIMINHPTRSLFIAAWPTGFAQIIFMMIYVCSSIWGPWVTYLAWAMWILDTVVSVLIILFISFLHMRVKTARELASFTALEMFPFLACIVASGTGTVVATAVPDPRQALATVIVSYILLGISLPMAFIVTTIYT